MNRFRFAFYFLTSKRLLISLLMTLSTHSLMVSASETRETECQYLPQGLLASWAYDRYLWQDSLDYRPIIEESKVVAIELTRLSLNHQLLEIGLNVGDKLTQINGVPVYHSQAFSAEVSQLTVQDSILLEFLNRPALRLIQQADQC